MNANGAKQDTDRVCVLLLARLLSPQKGRRSKRKLLEPVMRLLTRAGATAADAQDEVEAGVERCMKLGLVTEPLAIIEPGRAYLRHALGLERLPPVKDWADARRKIVLPLALGAPLQKTGKGALAAAVIAAERGLPGDRSLVQVVDALCWRELGHQTDEPFTAARVQRYLLRHLVALDARVKDPAARRRMVAAKLIGAARADAEELGQALLRRWIERGHEPREPMAAPPSKSGETEATRLALPEFADAVERTARGPGVARFHDDRAFIGSIWEHMRGRAPIGQMDLAQFKEMLVRAHRRGLLRMTRADLVGALDPAELQRSEAHYLDACFHFVALDEGGVQ